ncbi:MAG: TolC family protein, partial [Eudoraea sp.]|nr:TolC family protein [Eudoraea sp.]
MKKITLLLLFFISITASSQEKKTYDIGILVDYSLPELSPLLEELKNEITAVVGEDAIIRFSNEYILSNDLNLVKAEANYQSLVTSEVDIILAFGLMNNSVINKQTTFPKPTILFGAVNEDFIAIEKENQSSGIPNFTYLVTSRSHKKDLATFKELTGFKKVGIIIQQQFLNIFPYKTLFDKELEKLNAAYTLIPFNTYADIVPNLNDIDAVYIAEGFYLTDAEMKALAAECIRLKLPTFTANNIDEVKNGILATNQAEQNLTQFFRRIALTIERYVGGAELRDLPTYISFDANLTVNYNTAELIGLPLKYSLIAKTDFLGDFDKKVSEKKYNILQVMNDVLVNNLPLQSSQKEVDLSEKDVQAAWTNYLPSLTANTSATYVDPALAEISMGLNPEYSTAGNITLSQTLFSPDANANIKTQKDLLESQKQRFSAEQLDALFDASNAYFNALILKANLQI